MYYTSKYPPWGSPFPPLPLASPARSVGTARHLSSSFERVVGIVDLRVGDAKWVFMHLGGLRAITS